MFLINDYHPMRIAAHDEVEALEEAKWVLRNKYKEKDLRKIIIHQVRSEKLQCNKDDVKINDDLHGQV